HTPAGATVIGLGDVEGLPHRFEERLLLERGDELAPFVGVDPWCELETTEDVEPARTHDDHPSRSSDARKGPPLLEGRPNHRRKASSRSDSTSSRHTVPSGSTHTTCPSGRSSIPRPLSVWARPTRWDQALASSRASHRLLGRTRDPHPVARNE